MTYAMHNMSYPCVLWFSQIYKCKCQQMSIFVFPCYILSTSFSFNFFDFRFIRSYFHFDLIFTLLLLKTHNYQMCVRAVCRMQCGLSIRSSFNNTVILISWFFAYFFSRCCCCSDCTSDNATSCTWHTNLRFHFRLFHLNGFKQTRKYIITLLKCQYSMYRFSFLKLIFRTMQKTAVCDWVFNINNVTRQSNIVQFGSTSRMTFDDEFYLNIYFSLFGFLSIIMLESSISFLRSDIFHGIEVDRSSLLLGTLLSFFEV